MTTLEYKGFSVESTSLPQEALDYLLLNGFKQALGDSIAGLGKKLKEEGLDEAAVEAQLQAAMHAKFDAIVSGSVSVRSIGPRLQGEDKFIADYADEVLKAQFAKKSLKWPNGKGSAETIKTLRDKLLASQHGDKVRSEGKKRYKAYLAAQASEIDLDFSDLVE